MQLSAGPHASTAPAIRQAEPADATRQERLAAAKVIGEVIRDLATMRRQLERDNGCDASMASLTVLSAIERHGPLRVGEVAGLVDIDLSVASRHTTALEQRGLVLRQPSGDDRRAHVICVTECGQRTLAQARGWLADRLDASLSSWSTERLEALAEALAELRADMSAFIRTPGLGDPSQPNLQTTRQSHSGDTAR